MSRLMVVGSPTEYFEESVQGELLETSDIQTALDVLDDFNPSFIVVTPPFNIEDADVFLSAVDRNGIAPGSCAAIVVTKERSGQESLMKLDVYYTDEEGALALLDAFSRKSSDKTQIIDKLHVLHALARNVSKTVDMANDGKNPSSRHLKTSINKVAL